MIKTKKCIICNKEFETNDGRVKICSDKCRKEYKIYFKNKVSEKLNGIEGEDYIICKWCGMKVKRIYGKHIQKYHFDKTSTDYKKKFPKCSLMTSKDKHNISVNSGKFMREEKWRKWASERIKGDKNPNHKSNTMEQQRKEISPFSKEFYKKRGLSEEDRQKFIKNATKNIELDTMISYWIKRGFSEKEAKEKVSKRQRTFSLKICIEKYGEEKGLERWKERQKKWLSSYTFNNYSKVSQILFKQIFEQIKNDFNEIYFATKEDNGKNNEYRLDLFEKIILPDFFIKDIKKIIEFDGIYWHKNNPENKIREEARDKLILENDYKLLHIREDDFYNSPNYIIDKCIKFIYEKNS